MTWRDAGTSAAVSTVLFAVGSGLVTLYVRHKHMSDLYEGASAVVLAVMWVYYSTQVFLMGAEFTWVYANMYGSRRGKDALADVKWDKRRTVIANPDGSVVFQMDDVEVPSTWSQLATVKAFTGPA